MEPNAKIRRLISCGTVLEMPLLQQTNLLVLNLRNLRQGRGHTSQVQSLLFSHWIVSSNPIVFNSAKVGHLRRERTANNCSHDGISPQGGSICPPYIKP